jgi:Ca2+-binding RTX toxin-like protein
MATITNSIRDYIATKGSESRVIDLGTVFSGSGLTYSIESSDDDVAAVSVVDGKLTIDYTDLLGYTDLKITATDSTGHSVTDNVRVRVAGENAYTIAVLPDTQDYSYVDGAPTLAKMTQWLVDNKDSLGITFATHVGDVTASATEAQWQNVTDALSILNGKIPYALTAGNHDQGTGGSANSHTTPWMDQFYSPENQAAINDTFGGVYDMEPGRAANNYHTFTAPDGTKWLVLSLEFGPSDDVIRWGKEVIEDHLDHRVILTSHAYMNWAGRHDATGSSLYGEGAGYDYGLGKQPEGANDGETMYRELVKPYSNVTFTFSGHIFGDGAETLVSYDDFGNPVHQMLVNYQNGVSEEIQDGDGGSGAIRLLTIDPDSGQVYTSTYFALEDRYLTNDRGTELDRDDLEGPYRGQEEVLNLDLGAPELHAIAKAGNDLYVDVEGSQGATVTLAGRALNPANDTGLTYVWTDADGNVVATGATPEVSLTAGRHALTLTVTDSTGAKSSDGVLVVVGNDDTLLVDNFNDGNAEGWSTIGNVDQPEVLHGTTTSFGIAALPDGSTPQVTMLGALSPTERLHVGVNQPVPAGTIIEEYTMVYDMLIPAGSGWMSLLQTDTTNTSDGEFFIRADGGLGISGDYDGQFTYGAWHRVAFTIQKTGGDVLITKYIDGVKVGTTAQGATDRNDIDLSKGLLLFTDEDGETRDIYVSSVLFTDHVMNDTEVSTLGGVKAGGIVATAPSALSFQLDFSKNQITDTFGGVTATVGSNDNPSGNFVVKGSYAQRVDGVEVETQAEGRVFESSNTGENILAWVGDGSSDWKDYRYEVTLQSTDKDSIGAVFYYQDADNHYRVTFNAGTNTRELVRVSDGVETVLASDHGGSPWTRDAKLEIAIKDGEIRVFLDDGSVFGTVTDADPLSGGSVGFYSGSQKSSQFDDVFVGKFDLQAHAGRDLEVLDDNSDGKVTVHLDASDSYGPNDIVSWKWFDADGKRIGTGESADVTLSATGAQVVTLEVTDSAGNVARDTLTVDAVSAPRILFTDNFSNADFASRWTIVDEGEKNGAGASQDLGDWKVVDGRLVQLSDVSSRELTWTSADASDVWNKGWSPLGDGTNVLRKGTYAVLSDEDAADWTDYAVETTILTPDNGALGIMVHYQDPENYYKVELDAQNGTSLFQLIEVKDGVERYLSQIPARYTSGEAFKLRVEVVDNAIQAWMDGEAIFSYPIESRAVLKGTVALFSWGSAGLTFDDVTVVSLTGEEPPVTPPVTPPANPGNTAPTDLALAGAAIAENALVGDVVGTLSATDAEGNAISWTLAGGDGKFALKTVGGATQVVVNGTLDYETKSSYAITVTASDGSLQASKDFTISIGDIDEGNEPGEPTHVGDAGDDRLKGDDGDNVLLGKGGDDTVLGGAGNDELRGGAGNDRLRGGEGDDVLIGGTGADHLHGGGGADSFVFTSAGQSNGRKTDTIHDFRIGDGDVIDLTAVDADSETDGDQDFAFIGSGEFSGTAGELRVSTSKTVTTIEGDTNGDGKADFVLHLDGKHTVTADYFEL